MEGFYSRRKFLKTATAGGAALAISAASYSRVLGANDRISIGQIGCGSRGIDAHMAGIHAHQDTQNFEITAVCDPWRLRQEEAAAKAKEWYGREARKFSSYRDLVALKDVDAVMIASPDHMHTTHLEAVAKAGKDAYCEKPLAMTIESLKKACDAVKEAKIVVQIGTQLRSFPTFTGCRELYKTGVLGKVGRIEQCRNSERPYWYGYVKDAKAEDVDWKEFLGDRPMRNVRPGALFGLVRLPRILRRPRGGLCQPLHRPGALHHRREVPHEQRVLRRDLHLEGREQLHMPRPRPGAVDLPRGLHGQLLDELRQRQRQQLQDLRRPGCAGYGQLECAVPDRRRGEQQQERPDTRQESRQGS